MVPGLLQLAGALKGLQPSRRPAAVGEVGQELQPPPSPKPPTGEGCVHEVSEQGGEDGASCGLGRGALLHLASSPSLLRNHEAWRFSDWHVVGAGKVDSRPLHGAPAHSILLIISQRSKAEALLSSCSRAGEFPFGRSNGE